MEFALSQDQTMLQAGIRKALKDNNSIEKIRQCINNRLTKDNDIWQLSVSLGIPALLIPEQYNGLGMSLLDAALVAEELGRSCASIPFIGSMVISSLAISKMGSSSQKSKWLPKLAAGEVIIGAAVSEALHEKSQNLSIENGLLNGNTLFVLDGNQADAFIISINQQVYLIDAKNEGLSIKPQQLIDGSRPTVELVFDNVNADLLPGSSHQMIKLLLDAAWIMQAADTLGAAWHMIDESVAYSLVRKQFGRLIGSFQAVKHMCAEMATEIEPGRALVWYAAHAFDTNPDEAPLYASHAKALLGDAGHFVARTAIEVHGGIGITDDLGLHYWFKRIACNKRLLGSPKDALMRAAKLQNLLFD